MAGSILVCIFMLFDATAPHIQNSLMQERPDQGITLEHAQKLLGEETLVAKQMSEDQLVVLYRDAEAEEVKFGLIGDYDLNTQMKHIGGGIWSTTKTVEGLERALLTFSISANPGDRRQDLVYRGPNAPVAPAVAGELRGSLLNEKLKSTAMGEMRKVSVYLPPSKAEAVIFMPDGHVVEKFAKYLEPLILADEVVPIALVGSHIGDAPKKEGMPIDQRTLEYLEGIKTFVKEADETIFVNHMRFFIDELMPWAGERFGLPVDASSCALYGESNGAAFALSATHRHPGRFANVLLFSLLWKIVAEKQLPSSTLPGAYISIGTLEGDDITQMNEDLAKRWQALAPCKFSPNISGHDSLYWKEEFVRAMKALYGSE